MFLSQIVEKKERHYKGKVYDLKVKNKHSYTVDNLVVHNSSGASLVVYLLGITRLDPVKWNFNFERFLNEKKIGENLIKYRVELDDGREIELGENEMVKLKNGETKMVKLLHKDDEIDL
jgi:intein/homing endonuclease